MKKLYILICISICFFGRNNLYSQGCVAIRGFSGCIGNMNNTANLQKGEYQLGTNVRYFESFRHFRGDHEETHRVEQGTEVINNTYLADLSINYGITNRWFANLVLPYVNNYRSSMYEHGGNPPNGLGDRNSTSSSGLSDIRFGAGYWIFDPNTHIEYNYSVALGMKLPTGNYNYKDNFYNQGENRDQTINTVVDQSIQPGDGGYGVTIDLQGYHLLSSKFLLTSNFNYLLNPQATNGIKTRNGRSEFSCPDQFAARVGTFYISPFEGFGLYLGGRAEGVPSSDLIGSSEGYRRPGYVLSIDPGISYNNNRISVNLNIPVALYRNRIQSYEDKVRTADTGTFVQGDAAFADYLINFNISYRLGGNNSMISH